MWSKVIAFWNIDRTVESTLALLVLILFELGTLKWRILKSKLDPLFFNLETNLMVSWKVNKIQPIRVVYQKPGNLKFCAPYKIIYKNGRDSLNKKKRFFYFSLLNPRKNGLRRKSKVCPLDTQIKYLGLISHSKVFSSGTLRMVDIEIKAWSSLFLNLETNLLVSWKVNKIQPITVGYQKPGNLKFCAPFWKTGFLFFLLYTKKSGLSKKLKMSTLDIRIKQSGLKGVIGYVR